MDEHADRSLALARLTPELAAEVRRNLGVGLSAMVACLAAVSALFGIAVDPTFSAVTGGAAGLMFGLFVVLFVPCVAIAMVLVYLLGCWPALLRSRFLHEHLGVPAESLSHQARRKEIGAAGYWAAVGRGVIVGCVFMAVATLGWWGFTGKWSVGFPSLMGVLLGVQIASRAWLVRRVVARQVPPAAGPQGAPSGDTSSPGAD